MGTKSVRFDEAVYERVAVSLRSTARSLRSSLASLVAVLASPAFRQRVAPFSPAGLRFPDSSMRVGLKGAGISANPDDASTAGVSNANDEERSESREPKCRGLSRCSRLNHVNLNSTESSGAKF